MIRQPGIDHGGFVAIQFGMLGVCSFPQSQHKLGPTPVPICMIVICLIDGSEPMQNDQEHFFSDICLKFYNIIKIIL
jgi:hypothetical protein